MYKCECGREFEKCQSYVGHCSHCRIHLGREPKDRFGDSRSWARGKTKENDVRIRKMSESLKGRTGTFLGRHHSAETKAVMAEKARYNAKNHINGWKAGDSRTPNKYEVFTENFLIAHKVRYAKEVNIPQSLLGKSGSYYQLDFLIDDRIDLEIDGTAHNVEHDKIRDSYVSKMYDVYRIQHHDSIETLETKLLEFLSGLES